MTYPIRIAVQIQQQHADYAAIRRAVATAEEMGVDVVYNWDHFFPLFGPADGAHFECWTMLAAWAEATERIAFGALVTCNSYRNPQLLADMARTVDHISGGRLLTGMGSGWFERDYVEYGYEFGTAPGRLRNLDRDLPILKQRLDLLKPAPIGPLPILIGGGGEKVTLRIVAEHADIWHTFGSLATIGRKNQVLNDWCLKVGRDPAAIERSTGWSELGKASVTAADELANAGIHQFTLGVDGSNYDVSAVQDFLDWRDERNATTERGAGSPDQA